MKQRDVCGGRAAVSWWERGVQVSEAAITYAIYVLLAVLAVGGAIYIYGSITAGRVVNDVSVIVSAVQEMYSNQAEYTGLSDDLVGESGRLPEELVSCSTATPPVCTLWVGGTTDSLQVELTPGGGTNHASLGVPNARGFVMKIGSLAAPIREQDICADLAMLQTNGLRGVQIAADQAAGTLTIAAGVLPSATTPAANMTWRTFDAATIGALDDRNIADMQRICEFNLRAGEGVSLFLGFQ